MKKKQHQLQHQIISLKHKLYNNAYFWPFPYIYIHILLFVGRIYFCFSSICLFVNIYFLSALGECFFCLTGCASDVAVVATHLMKFFCFYFSFYAIFQYFFAEAIRAIFRLCFFHFAGWTLESGKKNHHIQIHTHRI